MANGQMGKGFSDTTKKRALELVKTLTIAQVAKRLGVSSSVVRNWVRDSGGKPSDK